MTAKEKAKELFVKFIEDTKDWSELDGYVVNEYSAKQCALIAVNQMISMLPFTDLTTYIGKWCEQQRQYLEEVKQEIEKL
jgi:hypothetical protein